MTKSILRAVFFTVIHLSVAAQTRGLFVPTDNGQTEPAANEKRIALVIGNKSYNSGGWQPLRNPTNDANLMLSTLRTVGFEVISLNDASREQMLTAINQLTAKISEKQTVVLVYYAGHGVEAEGKNWLVPVNDRSACRDDIAANCISLDFINNKLKNAGAAFNIIISDACRNMTLPFTCPASGRDGSKTGFVEFKAKGSCIAFSTAPNATAADGSGSNSPYTAALSRAIAKEGLTIEAVFKQVSRELDQLGQEPWVNNAFSGEFYFKMPTSAPTPTPMVVTPRQEPTPSVITPNTPSQSDYTESVAGISFAMKFITGRSFQMGSNESDIEKPIHTVQVGNFFMSKYEVTNQEFCAFLNSEGNKTEGGVTWLELGSADYYDITESGGRFSVKSGRNRQPIRNVSWYGAIAYAVWLSAKTGKSYRLPTEAEWEFSARGGQSYKYAGSDNLEDVAWVASNSGSTTHDVGTKQGNGFGLYDMTGNVWEWCSDLYGTYSSGSQQNPTGATTGSFRVYRGGGWYDSAEDCRVALRSSNTPTYRLSDLGFRLAISSPQ